MKTFSRGWFTLLATVVLAAWVGPMTAAESVLLSLTNSWRYNQTSSYDGVNWTAPDFDDSSLPAGRGVLGNESANSFVTTRTNTVLTIGRTTYYFRTHFTAPTNLAGASLVFSNIVDDGAVYYLNGVEVARLFMTNNSTAVSYATLTSNHEATAFDVFTLSGPIVETNLVAGDNVLAVEVHQTAANSSDIVFGLALSLNVTELTPAPLRMPLEPPVFGYTVVPAFGSLNNFTNPVCITAPPGETNRLFVLSRGGRILVITNLASPNLTVFLDISSKVTTPSESGLLGLAFHPGYATNRLFFVYYSQTNTTAQGTNRLHQQIARFETSPVNANQALLNSEIMLLAQADPAPNHNGGDLHFGPDGYLYVSLGDGGVQRDGSGNSQHIDRDFFSAIMRLDVDSPPRPTSLMPNPHPANTNWGAINYRIPGDNPFIGRTVFDGIAVNPANLRTEFYAIGFRNPWRYSFDPLTGFLYCGDVGQDAWEEVDIVTKGGNYGWAYREALHAGFKAGTPAEPLIDPIQEYAHGSAANQGNSVIGGVVYRGSRFSQLYGSYVFGDNTTGNIWKLRYDGTNTVPFERIATRSGISAFGVDPSNGDVLIADVAGSGIYRLTYNTNSASGLLIPPTLADTGAFTNLTSLTNSTQSLAPSGGMAPYEVNLPFWSDNARKTRWFLANTNLKVGFAPEGNWDLPAGLAWVKHFDLELTNGVPTSARRLETRVLVKNSNGVYGVTYRWGNSLTNATLVPDEGLNEEFVINDGGNIRTQVWHYPSRTECIVCHSSVGGYALGFNTLQLNRTGAGGSNQLAALEAAGLFSAPVSNRYALRAFATPTNEAVSREWRVRSYLAVNCSHCHQPGGTGLGEWTANIQTRTADAGLINGPLSNNGGNANARVIAPGSIPNSALLTRISTRGPMQMPPVDTTIVDPQGTALISAWITNDLASGYTNIASSVLVRAHAANPGVALEFTQPSNAATRVEATANLTPPVSWQFLNVPENQPTYPSTNLPVTVPDSTGSTQKFYRVRITSA